MRRCRRAALGVLTALLAAGCSMEYEMSRSPDREAPEATAEQAPGAPTDSGAGSADGAKPGLLARSDAEDRIAFEESVDAPAEPTRACTQAADRGGIRIENHSTAG